MSYSKSRQTNLFMDLIFMVCDNPLTIISVPFGYKIKRLHSLPQTSTCGDLIVLDNAKVK